MRRLVLASLGVVAVGLVFTLLTKGWAVWAQWVGAGLVMVLMLPALFAWLQPPARGLVHEFTIRDPHGHIARLLDVPWYGPASTLRIEARGDAETLRSNLERVARGEHPASAQ